MSSRLAPEELRTLFLFEQLDDEQLAWLAERGRCRTYPAGTVVYHEGDPQAELFVLLDGALRMSRAFAGEQVLLVETTHRGAYAGAVRAYVDDGPTYGNTVVATAPSSFWVLPASDFSAFLHTRYPMAVHLLDGLFLGMRNSEATIRSREQLARLGALSADLAHELNNPAGAAVRATGQLRERVTELRDQLGQLASGALEPTVLAALVTGQQDLAALASQRRGQPLGALEEADREDALADRLDALGVGGAYDRAAQLAAAGLEVADLDRVLSDVGPGAAGAAVPWLAATLETAQLLDEIEEATGRISTLVAAVKQYSYRDSASVQDVDVHVGLEATVTMLGTQLQGVRVVRDYDRSLPAVPVHAGELNQVWTNLIDNAADALGGSGTLTLRTSRDGDAVLVEVADDGPGIPAEVQPRVFEAFFTTKGVGEGSGLGLDNARRIVEQRHRGRLGLVSGPGGTTFSVRLPLAQPLD